MVIWRVYLWNSCFSFTDGLSQYLLHTVIGSYAVNRLQHCHCDHTCIQLQHVHVVSMHTYKHCTTLISAPYMYVHVHSLASRHLPFFRKRVWKGLCKFYGKYLHIHHVFIHTCNTVATGNSISSHEYYASESLLNDLNKTLIITMLWVGCKRSLNLHVTTRLSVENNHLLN